MLFTFAEAKCDFPRDGRNVSNACVAGPMLDVVTLGEPKCDLPLEAATPSAGSGYRFQHLFERGRCSSPSRRQSAISGPKVEVAVEGPCAVYSVARQSPPPRNAILPPSAPVHGRNDDNAQSPNLQLQHLAEPAPTWRLSVCRPVCQPGCRPLQVPVCLPVCGLAAGVGATISRWTQASLQHRRRHRSRSVRLKRTNLPVVRLSLNRSQYGGCSTKYDTLTVS